MAKGFKRVRRGVSVDLEDGERTLIDHLFAEVEELLDPGSDEDASAGPQDPLEAMVGIGTATSEPADPALARLLPSAHRDDADISAEFRRYTEQGLRERKRAGIALARQTLAEPGPLTLTKEQAQAWLVALNDVRLVLGERLELRTDEDAEALALQLATADQEDPRTFLAAIYDFLTWLQESLVRSLRP